MKNEATEATIAAVAQKATYGGGTVAFFGGLSANEVAAIGGLLVAVVGLIVQLYYKRKHDRRESDYHARRMARLDADDPDEYGADGP